MGCAHHGTSWTFYDDGYSWTYTEFDANGNLTYQEEGSYDSALSSATGITVAQQVLNGSKPISVQPISAQTTPNWHHLLPQALADKFDKIGIKVNDAIWGWIMSPDDHSKLHAKGWNNEWKTFFKKFEDDGKIPTLKDIKKQLNKMTTDKRFKDLLAKGAQASVSFTDWHDKFTPAGRVNQFKKLRKAMKILAGVAAVLGGAETASAAFGPVIAMGDEDALRDYRAAVEALQAERYDLAEKALFGNRDATNILDPNPPGLITKMLSRWRQANEGSADKLMAVYTEALRVFNELKQDARIGI